jgi:hypothetical protein
MEQSTTTVEYIEPEKKYPVYHLELKMMPDDDGDSDTSSSSTSNSNTSY